MKKCSTRIMYIITLPILGGAQVHLNDVIRNLPDDIEPNLLVGQDGWLATKVKEKTENVFVVPSLVRQISPLNDIKAFWAVRQLIKKMKPDLVHCHSSKAGIIGRLAAWSCGIPAVFTAHGWAFTEGVSPGKRYIYKLMERVMAQCTRKIICVSDYDRNLALTVMPEQADKMLTIHNGVPCIKKIDQPKNNERLRLVMVARFCAPKQQRELITAVHELLVENPEMDLSLALIGDGPEYEAVKKYTLALENNGFVDFLGAQADAAHLLNQYDVFVLISRWEGLPISILEAMRQGLPVIASDVGGIKEMVKDEETGFLIPRENLALLKEKIKQLYDDRDTCNKLGQQGRNKYIAEFTSESMMKKLVRIYQDVLH